MRTFCALSMDGVLRNSQRTWTCVLWHVPVSKQQRRDQQRQSINPCAHLPHDDASPHLPVLVSKGLPCIDSPIRPLVSHWQRKKARGRCVILVQDFVLTCECGWCSGGWSSMWTSSWRDRLTGSLHRSPSLALIRTPLIQVALNSLSRSSPLSPPANPSTHVLDYRSKELR